MFLLWICSDNNVAKSGIILIALSHVFLGKKEYSHMAKYQGGGYYFLKDKLIQDNYIKANIKNL